MEDHERIISAHLAGLVCSIDARNTPLWERLIELEVIQNIEVEVIRESSETNLNEVRCLLSHICRRPAEDYEKFKQALVDSGQGHVVQRFLSPAQQNVPEAGETEAMEVDGSDNQQ